MPAFQPDANSGNGPRAALPRRIVIYPKDVQIITGRTLRTGARLLNEVRKAYGKEKHQLVTITEFAIYIGISEKLLQDFLLK